MTLGERLKRLRQEHKWSQAQFSTKLNVHQKQVSGYERDIHVPSIDVLVRAAEIFNVSLDYLAIEHHEQTTPVQIADRELLRKLEAVDKLSDQDKSTIKAVLDSFILKSQFQQLANINDKVSSAI